MELFIYFFQTILEKLEGLKNGKFVNEWLNENNDSALQIHSLSTSKTFLKGSLILILGIYNLNNSRYIFRHGQFGSFLKGRLRTVLTKFKNIKKVHITCMDNFTSFLPN